VSEFPSSEESALQPSNAIVSVVVPLLNEADGLWKLAEELRQVCDAEPESFELIFVDDGSTDDSCRVLAALHQADERVKFLSLSRNFGHQAALSAGLEYARGDAVIMMDADLQHPPAVIPELLRHWRLGYDVVNTIRRQTASVSTWKRLTASGFYRVFNWLSQVTIPPGSADFRLMARPALNALIQLPERHRFLRGLVPWLGFRQTSVPYDAPARFAGKSKYTFSKSLRLALAGITAFSLYPLRNLITFGCGVVLVSLLAAGAAVGAVAWGMASLPSWTPLFLCTTFLGGCQLAALGVLGEYLGRVLEQVKGRPLYIVQQAVGFSTGCEPMKEVARQATKPADWPSADVAPRRAA